MSNIDKRALREAAEKATKGQWAVEFDDEVYSTDGVNNEQIAMVFSENEVRDAAFIAAANPATVLALLDELEAKDNRINRLEAIVAVAEQRNALMREWKRALKAPCDLVDDQVPVVIHGMVIRLERLKETEAKLEVAEKRNERALALLKDANTENVWEIIGRLKVVISGDYRSEAEIAAAATAGKGE
ncbi:ead/Ea22-like family protein [Enterobacter hormaechei]|uniref:ead/Ea22-like family protein n=1 Tax=Enterobacter hormaechei TaxID=158836 RepID=UPI002075451C|nr:ead/Ea22-like family protein [Enterobacter hormaechei]MCM7887984.1 ead/Ea22-like family protein [Enterobacter hormaechei]MCM7892636.1 ead/Ea22-like family protein [Enterobacter hormaechei]MCM7897324.1 ead/Ea22-like family protein [Enterobacter hormaechei]MCM7901983.1 ead/Ea22-like family protein [Enterobacter hormaechei]MCM7911212.1 ead/Ea22-like family protein [Enterobacter hormaechei]